MKIKCFLGAVGLTVLTIIGVGLSTCAVVWFLTLNKYVLFVVVGAVVIFCVCGMYWEYYKNCVKSHEFAEYLKKGAYK